MESALAEDVSASRRTISPRTQFLPHDSRHPSSHN
jgi:hypothetical protein